MQGQALDFPKQKNQTDVNLLARPVVESAIEKSQSRKKKSR